eukprot:scaffold16041_cov90-Isochrysis_galbana.AAC.3
MEPALARLERGAARADAAGRGRRQQTVSRRCEPEGEGACGSHLVPPPRHFALACLRPQNGGGQARLAQPARAEPAAAPAAEIPAVAPIGPSSLWRKWEAASERTEHAPGAARGLDVAARSTRPVPASLLTPAVSSPSSSAESLSSPHSSSPVSVPASPSPPVSIAPAVPISGHAALPAKPSTSRISASSADPPAPGSWSCSAADSPPDAPPDSPAESPAESPTDSPSASLVESPLASPADSSAEPRSLSSAVAARSSFSPAPGPPCANGRRGGGGASGSAQIPSFTLRADDPGAAVSVPPWDGVTL